MVPQGINLIDFEAKKFAAVFAKEFQNVIPLVSMVLYYHHTLYFSAESAHFIGPIVPSDMQSSLNGSIY